MLLLFKCLGVNRTWSNLPISLSKRDPEKILLPPQNVPPSSPTASRRSETGFVRSECWSPHI